MNAIAVLTTSPSHDLLEFYSGFARLGYQVFIIIDDNNFNCDNAAVKKDGVSLIQLNDYECRRAGFYDLNPPVIKKRSCCGAWEKALYYFCRRDLSQGNVWFIEDDVFIANHEAIWNTDRKYEKADIISASNEVNEYGLLLDDWDWWKCVPENILRPPWAKSMVCAVRLSRQMLTDFDFFIRSNKSKIRFQNAKRKFVARLARLRGRRRHVQQKYLFIEYTFHTLARHKQLSVVEAQELSGISWNNVWDVLEMDSRTLYHPVKDRELQSRYRKILNQQHRSPTN